MFPVKFICVLLSALVGRGVKCVVGEEVNGTVVLTFDCDIFAQVNALKSRPNGIKEGEDRKNQVNLAEPLRLFKADIWTSGFTGYMTLTEGPESVRIVKWTLKMHLQH